MRLSLREIGLVLLLAGIVGCSPNVEPLIEERAAVTEAPARVADGFFDSNGVQIHYTDVGDGEPLVLIHGFTGNLGTFELWGFVEALVESSYRVISIDARGHGQSDKPHEVELYGTEMVDDVARLLDHLMIDTAHVLGYSMGGVITNKMRETYPERMRTAILGGAGWLQREQPLLEDLEVSDLAEDLRSGNGIGSLMRALTPAGQPEPTDEQIAQFNEERLATNDVLALAAVMDGFDAFAVSETDLRENQVPTLALIGEVDPLKAGVDALEAVMADLEVRVVPDANHMTAGGSPLFIDGLLAYLREHREDSPAPK